MFDLDHDPSTRNARFIVFTENIQKSIIHIKSDSSTYFAGVFYAFRITGANVGAINASGKEIVHPLTFGIIHHWHSHVLELRGRRTF